MSIDRKALKRVAEFAGKFDSERSSVIKTYIGNLRARRMDWNGILSVVDLSETTSNTGIPEVFFAATNIAENVIKNRDDERGNRAVRRFMEMATSIAHRAGPSANDALHKQAAIVMGIAEFTENLYWRRTIAHDDLQGIFELTTGLLETYVGQGKSQNAAYIASKFLPKIGKTHSTEDIKDNIVMLWSRTEEDTDFYRSALRC